jgi:sialate O-acetylesterase
MRWNLRICAVPCLGILTILVALAAPATADVRLPSIFTDNMVLQRDMPVPVWGWADPGEKVTVRVLGQTQTAEPGEGGKWTVKLAALKTGGPITVTISGKNTVTLRNVLVGEVWLCSGQSNMQFNVGSCNQAQEEIAAANYPQIRLVSVPTVGTQEPQSNFKGAWVQCSPRSVGNFSAVGYFFGRELYRNLNVPIGLVHCSWGGSSCEAWVKRSRLEADPQYRELLAKWDHDCATFDMEKAKAAYKAQLDKWKKAAAAAKAAGKTATQPPRAPQDIRTGQHRPANCYNGMLLPVETLAIRGVIWYQGESNSGRAYQYRSLFPLMIKNWRDDWGQGDFPFYFVQLANFMAVKPAPAESGWAELREAQTMTLKVPHTGQAVIIDIGDAANIHPKNKQDVGKRLALWALAKDYGKDLEYSSPMYKSMRCKGNQVTICFDFVGGSLVAKDGAEVKGFAIAGADKKFVWAQAKIVGQTVVVSSSEVAEPVAVRYAWADNPVCNLYSEDGLPVCPFRTDTWPGITAHNNK